MTAAAAILRTTVAALRRDYEQAANTAIAANRESPARVRDIEARANSLHADHARRVAAGVRVSTALGTFDARHVTLLDVTAKHHEAVASANGKLAQSLAVVALRALQAVDAAAQALEVLEAREAVASSRATAQARADAAEAAEREDADRSMRESTAWRAGLRERAIADGTYRG